jgi:putative aldouronate transport system permease protein
MDVRALVYHRNNLPRGTRKRSLLKRVLMNYQLYLFLLPTVAWYIIFCYGPMYGIQIAFKDFNGAFGILGSPWVGLKHFRNFFSSYYITVLLRNTIILSLYSLAASFPFPIILALMLKEVKNDKFRRLVQTTTYAPHFISTVVLVGMIKLMLSPRFGVVNLLLQAVGFEAKNYLAISPYFRHIYVWSGIWQNVGWGSIIYLAALSQVNPEHHEAAMIDGAGRLRRIWHINIPAIIPTMSILLILRAGSVMSVGFEKVFLMQNDLILDRAEVISTYIYRRGLLNANYSFASAVGLFNNVVNFLMLLIVNGITRKLSETTLF